MSDFHPGDFYVWNDDIFVESDVAWLGLIVSSGRAALSLELMRCSNPTTKIATLHPDSVDAQLLSSVAVRCNPDE